MIAAFASVGPHSEEVWGLMLSPCPHQIRRRLDRPVTDRGALKPWWMDRGVGHWTRQVSAALIIGHASPPIDWAELHLVIRFVVEHVTIVHIIQVVVPDLSTLTAHRQQSPLRCSLAKLIDWEDPGCFGCEAALFFWSFWSLLVFELVDVWVIVDWEFLAWQRLEDVGSWPWMHLN